MIKSCEEGTNIVDKEAQEDNANTLEKSNLLATDVMLPRSAKGPAKKADETVLSSSSPESAKKKSVKSKIKKRLLAADAALKKLERTLDTLDSARSQSEAGFND